MLVRYTMRRKTKGYHMNMSKLVAVTTICVAMAGAAFASVATEKVEVSSPDGAITFAVRVDGRLGYEISYRGAMLVERSSMGFSFLG